MINRWFHVPRIHEATQLRRVGWLELFFDLAFVAAFIQLGSALAGHLDVYGFLAFAGVFSAMWLAWADVAFYDNRYVALGLAHRVLVFAQIFAVGGMAMAAGPVLDGDIAGFLSAMAVVKSLFAVVVVRTWWQNPEVRRCGGPDAANHVAAALLWVVAAQLASPWNALVAALAVLVRVLGKLFGTRLDELSLHHPPDVRLLSQRYGIFTLLVLAGSFLRVLTAMNARGGDATVAVMAGLVLCIAFSLWWMYFDDVTGGRIRRTRLAGYTWMWAHLPLTMAVAAAGVASEEVVFLDVTRPAPAAERTFLAGGLVLALLSVAAIDLVTDRQHSLLPDRRRVQLRLGAAAMVGVVGLAGGGMTALVFLSLLGGVSVLQVFLDLTMAPQGDPEAAALNEPVAWDVDGITPGHADDDNPDPGAEALKPRDRLGRLGTAVRRGVPNEFRSDLYYWFMDGSWTRMLLSLGLVWVMSNVFFGALYLLEPGSVANIHEGSFLEAFSFSVQTMSGIGYGVMAPQTDYAHALVAVEAIVGLLGIALATGLVFAKASRPSLSVVFSQVAVIHQRDGKPTLEFRVGNARGTEVVEATIHVAALIAEVSAEGHRMTRLHDLDLHRKMTPMFALTWSVMHTLDEHSPVGCLQADPTDERVVGIVCTLTGHDATYGQTTHARHIYGLEDLRFEHDFVDVVETLPDGRLQVDFARFHDTRPQVL